MQKPSPALRQPAAATPSICASRLLRADRRAPPRQPQRLEGSRLAAQLGTPRSHDRSQAMIRCQGRA